MGKQVSAVSVYDHDVVVDVLMRHDGSATARELCRELGVSAGTFNHWFKNRPDFAELVTELRRSVDDKVVASLYDRAVGYSGVAKVVKERDGEGNLVVTREETLHVAPDVAAQKLWLVNRDPDNWSDTRKVEVVGTHNEHMRRLMTVLDLAEDEYEVVDG